MTHQILYHDVINSVHVFWVDNIKFFVWKYYLQN